MGDAVARRVERDGSLFDNCGSAVLCHDDLHEGNVLVAQRPGGWQVTGVIDVENAIVADPLQRDFPAPARARIHRRPRQTSSEARYDEEHLRTECALGGSAQGLFNLSGEAAESLEPVSAGHQGHVVMPAAEGTSLEIAETQVAVQPVERTP